MKLNSRMICALALSALAATAAQAQAPRSTIKADAAANAASQPKGEMSVANQDRGSRPRASNTPRETVKGEARAATAARADGTLPKGEQSTATQGKKPAPGMASDKSRASVKAEAAAANRSGTTTRGQSSQKDQDKGGVKP